MTSELNGIIDSLDKADKLFMRFLNRHKNAKGDARQLVEELKKNSRLLWLVTKGEESIDNILKDLQTKKYEELNSSGFNFNTIKRRKIKVKSLPKSLMRWNGRSTEQLIVSIYEKLNTLLELYPRTKNSKKIRWSVRVINIQKRISLLLRHIS